MRQARRGAGGAVTSTANRFRQLVVQYNPKIAERQCGDGQYTKHFKLGPTKRTLGRRVIVFVNKGGSKAEEMNFVDGRGGKVPELEDHIAQGGSICSALELPDELEAILALAPPDEEEEIVCLMIELNFDMDLSPQDFFARALEVDGNGIRLKRVLTDEEDDSSSLSSVTSSPTPQPDARQSGDQRANRTLVRTPNARQSGMHNPAPNDEDYDDEDEEDEEEDEAGSLPREEAKVYTRSFFDAARFGHIAGVTDSGPFRTLVTSDGQEIRPSDAILLQAQEDHLRREAARRLEEEYTDHQMMLMGVVDPKAQALQHRYYDGSRNNYLETYSVVAARDREEAARTEAAMVRTQLQEAQMNAAVLEQEAGQNYLRLVELQVRLDQQNVAAGVGVLPPGDGIFQPGDGVLPPDLNFPFGPVPQQSFHG